MGFPSQQLSFAGSFLAKGGSVCPHHFLPDGISSELNMCALCMRYLSPCEFICTSALFCLEDTLLDSSTCSDSYNLLITEYSKVYNSCLSAVQLWIFLFIIMYCLKKLLWWELSGAVVYRHSTMLLGGVLVLCSLSRIIVGGFPLESMTSISSLRFLASWTVLGMVSISRRIP